MLFVQHLQRCGYFYLRGTDLPDCVYSYVSFFREIDDPSGEESGVVVRFLVLSGTEAGLADFADVGEGTDRIRYHS